MPRLVTVILRMGAAATMVTDRVLPLATMAKAEATMAMDMVGLHPATMTMVEELHLAMMAMARDPPLATMAGVAILTERVILATAEDQTLVMAKALIQAMGRALTLAMVEVLTLAMAKALTLAMAEVLNLAMAKALSLAMEKAIMVTALMDIHLLATMPMAKVGTGRLRQVMVQHHQVTEDRHLATILMAREVATVLRPAMEDHLVMGDLQIMGMAPAIRAVIQGMRPQATEVALLDTMDMVAHHLDMVVRRAHLATMATAKEAHLAMIRMGREAVLPTSPPVGSDRAHDRRCQSTTTVLSNSLKRLGRHLSATRGRSATTGRLG